MELLSVPRQNALFAECRGGEAAAKSLMERRQGFFQIRFFHQPPGISLLVMRKSTLFRSLSTPG